MFAFAVISIFVLAALAPMLKRVMGANAGWALALWPALLFLYFAGFVPDVANGERFVFSLPWVPTIGINLSFFLDGLSLLFALLITGIGAFILIYADGYLKGHPHHGRFFSYLLMFMGSMLGVVLADNIITLFVFWELTSITSFLLIGFDHSRMASRRAALQALIITGGGGLVLLAGLVLMGMVAGNMEISQILAQGDVIRDHPYYVAILLLVLGGCFTKSAQFPFHVWLPNAMEAPTPVSAYLHSATMVKAGVYLLMRLNPILGETDLWYSLLIPFGGITLLVGTILAVRQTDLKLMLAYTTVASLGLLVMLTGVGTEKALAGAVLYLFAHSLFKGALFMVAGILDHETGTRQVTALGGLRKLMPITFAAAVLAALSMSGILPFIGFVAKEVLYAALAYPNLENILILIVMVAGNALMLVIAAAIAILPFFGEEKKTPKHAHEGPMSLWLGPLTLASAGLVAGVLTELTAYLLILPMTNAVYGGIVDVDIHLWEGFNVALLLSVITVALGLLIFWQLLRARAFIISILHAIGWGPDKGFDQAVAGLVNLSYRFTRLIQTGELRHYVLVTFLVVLAALYLPLWAYDNWPAMPAFPQLFFYEWLVYAITIIGVTLVVISRSRLVAILSLGVQGVAVALIFLMYSAPDLAFTQFMVETLSVVILTLVLTRLKLDAEDNRLPIYKLRDAVIAGLTGIGFGLVLLGVVAGDFDTTFAEFFAEYSYQIAHGRNLVNVILVDFRGIDTFGEIIVVLAAALACRALIRLKPVENKL